MPSNAVRAVSINLVDVYGDDEVQNDQDQDELQKLGKRLREYLKIEGNKINDTVKHIRQIRNSDKYKVRYQEAIRFQNDPKKSATESDLYREKGNQRYAERKFIPALEYFNKSICFAPEHSEQLAKGYANRSAVYFSLNMFELALKNIKEAREAGYPEQLLPKLNEREAKCLEKLKKLEEKPKNTFNGLKPELSYPPHEKVPFIANCLDLKVNEENGHQIIASIDLKVGDVVAIESPFVAVISPRFRYMVCAHCFRENNLNLIPCPNCHSVMFCSPECLAAANEGFHAIECPIMDVLVRSDELSYQAYIAFRLFVLAMKQFESVDELMKFVKDLENDERNVFNVNYEQNQIVDLLASTLKLKLIFPDAGSKIYKISSLATFTALTVDVILNLTDFKESFKSVVKINFLIDFIFHLNTISILNVINGSNLRKVVPEMKHLLNWGADMSCYGIFPFSSLLTNSDPPNAIVYKCGAKHVVTVSRPIKSGEKLIYLFGALHSADRFYPQINNCFIKSNQHMKLCAEYNVDAIVELIPKYLEFLNEKTNDSPDYYIKIAEEVLWSFWHQVYTDEVSFIDKIQYRFK